MSQNVTRKSIAVDANLHEPFITRKQASEIVGVSPRTIASVKKVEQEAPELMPKLESAFVKEATSNNYDNLLMTVAKWVNVY